jgi:hypothetical protein
MKILRDPGRAAADALVLGCLLIIVILLAIQFWLLVSSLDAYLSGDDRLALPSVLFSGLCAAFALGAGALSRGASGAGRARASAPSLAVGALGKTSAFSGGD